METQNSNILRKFNEDNKLTSLEAARSLKIVDTLQPVQIVDATAETLIKGATALNGGYTLYTTPTDRDFYLTNAILAYEKDVTNAATSISMGCVINGAAVNIIILPTIALVAEKDSISITFNRPIKLDRNTTIAIGASNYTPNIRIGGTATGYLT
jgi:hypothetical protein